MDNRQFDALVKRLAQSRLSRLAGLKMADFHASVVPQRGMRHWRVVHPSRRRSCDHAYS